MALDPQRQGAATIRYRIDASDRITYVDPGWMRFAADNEAPELTELGVLGVSLWELVHGAEVRALYAELFRRLRAGHRELLLSFRCDAPDRRRDMELTLRSLRRGAIEIESRLLRETPREPVALLSREARRSEARVPICSLCRRLRIADDWLEVEDAIERGRLFRREPVPVLDETVCPACRERAA